MADDNVSKQVVFQRVRNRIIEYFEVASSFDEQQNTKRLCHWLVFQVR